MNKKMQYLTFSMVTILLVIGSVMYFNQSKEYQKLRDVNLGQEKKIEVLTSDLASMQNRVNEVEGDNNSLRKDNNSLMKDNNTLMKDNNSLIKDNNSLKKDIESEIGEYEKYTKQNELDTYCKDLVNDFHDNYKVDLTDEEAQKFYLGYGSWYLDRIQETNEYVKYFRSGDLISIKGQTRLDYETLHGLEMSFTGARIVDYDYVEYKNTINLCVTYLGVTHNYWKFEDKWYKYSSYLDSPISILPEYSQWSEVSKPKFMEHVFSYAKQLKAVESTSDVNSGVTSELFEDMKNKVFGVSVYRMHVYDSSIAFGPIVEMYKIDSIEENNGQLVVKYTVKMKSGDFDESIIVDDRNVSIQSTLIYYGDYIEWNGNVLKQFID